jgi:hypothetical protein
MDAGPFLYVPVICQTTPDTKMKSAISYRPMGGMGVTVQLAPWVHEHLSRRRACIALRLRACGFSYPAGRARRRPGQTPFAPGNKAHRLSHIQDDEASRVSSFVGNFRIRLTAAVNRVFPRVGHLSHPHFDKYVVRPAQEHQNAFGRFAARQLRGRGRVRAHCGSSLFLPQIRRLS